jgi:UDP-N-acetylglucosamine--N-acetylmuramyl-(pentapeptide) pyrophosphoryl-undecaprenol N-acetylglucosamine transferase
MKIVITGGHFSPAYSLIQELKGHDIVVIGRRYAFEGDRNETFEYKVCKKFNIPFEVINAGRLQRKFTKHTIPAAARFPQGIAKSLQILKKEKPSVVVTFGGYVGLPVAIAARLLSIPVVLHEQTLHAGLSARLISKFASVILTSFPSSKDSFKGKNVVLTGNPIRPELLNYGKKLKHAKPLIYITGGSTGSHAINSAVSQVIPQLLSEFIVFHQTGDSHEFGDYDKIKKIQNDLPSELRKSYFVEKFFPPDKVATLIASASFVISRSGINTVTELIALKTPAILIPLPHGQHNEQLQNAKFFESLGLGHVLMQDDITAHLLLATIHAMIKEKSEFEKKFQEAQVYIHHDAVKKIAKEVLYYGERNSSKDTTPTSS